MFLAVPAEGRAAPSRGAPDPKVQCQEACYKAALRAHDDLYRKEKYEEALQAWDALYVVTPSPQLLTNIASTLYKLNRCEEALAAYRLLSTVRNSWAPDRVDSAAWWAKTMAKLEELEVRCGTTAAPSISGAAPAAPAASGTTEVHTTPDAAAAPTARAPAPVPAVSPSPLAAPSSAPAISVHAEERPVYKRAWLWATVGGVALAATAIGLGVGLGMPRAPEPSQGFSGMTFALNF